MIRIFQNPRKIPNLRCLWSPGSARASCRASGPSQQAPILLSRPTPRPQIQGQTHKASQRLRTRQTAGRGLLLKTPYPLPHWKALKSHLRDLESSDTQERFSDSVSLSYGPEEQVVVPMRGRKLTRQAQKAKSSSHATQTQPPHQPPPYACVSPKRSPREQTKVSISLPG